MNSVGTAWSVRERVCILLRPRLYEQMRLTYIAMSDVNVTIKQFCKHFIYLQYIFLILTTAIRLLASITVCNTVHFILTITYTAGFQMMPIWIAASITSQMGNIHCLVHNVYYDDNRFCQYETSAKKWTLKTAHNEALFDLSLIHI